MDAPAPRRRPGAAWPGRGARGKFPRLGRHDELLAQPLGGRADANAGFDALRALLRALGSEERTRGSHDVFRRAGVWARINLQREGDKAKAYQVRQVRAVLVEHGLAALAPDGPTEGGDEA